METPSDTLDNPLHADYNFENSHCRGVIAFKDHVKNLLLRTMCYFFQDQKTQVQDLKTKSSEFPIVVTTGDTKSSTSFLSVRYKE